MPKDGSAWLVNTSGHSYLDGIPTDTFLENSEICRGLVHVNLFAGRATSIEEIPNGKQHLLRWLKGESGTEKDKRDYLVLKGFDRPALDKTTRLLKDLKQEFVPS